MRLSVKNPQMDRVKSIKRGNNLIPATLKEMKASKKMKLNELRLRKRRLLQARWNGILRRLNAKPYQVRIKDKL